MFFGLTMWNCFLLLRGKLKIKHVSLFITRGGEERMKGGLHGFRGNRGRETVIAKRVKRGGYRTTEHWLLMRGIIKILQSFGGRGGTRLISVWYNKNPPKHGKACMDGSTQKKNINGFHHWTIHGVALPVHFCQFELEFRMLVFLWRRKTGGPKENPLEQGWELITNSIHMTTGPGFKPSSHWWEGRTLTTAPSLLPQLKPKSLN